MCVIVKDFCQGRIAKYESNYFSTLPSVCIFFFQGSSKAMEGSALSTCFQDLKDDGFDVWRHIADGDSSARKKILVSPVFFFYHVYPILSRELNGS